MKSKRKIPKSPGPRSPKLAALETEGKAKDEEREDILENIFKTSFTPPSSSVEKAEEN